MSAAHTPGPWLLDPPSQDHIVDDEYHAIVAGDGVATERYKGFTLQTFMSIEDARLIAAAPELLEALKGLEAQGWLRHIEQQALSAPGSEIERDVLAHVAGIRAVIAKATGEAA